MEFRPIDIFGVCAAAGCLYLGFRLKKMSGKYEEAIDKIANEIDIDISNEIIEAAVDKAVDREAALQVNNACNRAVRLVQSDIFNTVQAAVNAEKKTLNEDVKKAIEKKLADIDISDAKKEVIEMAQEIVANRLEEDTKAIAGTYEASIKKVAEMCENMISTATISAQKAREPVTVGDVKTVMKLFDI